MTPAMPDFRAINAHAHAGWLLGPHQGYGFVARLSGVEVMANEAHRVACDLPMVWRASGEAAWTLLASPVDSSAWPVSPAGVWLGTYIPLLLRVYPFAPGAMGASVVGAYVDVNSPMVSPPTADLGPGWHAWFDAQGQASAAMAAALEVLRGVHRARQETLALGRALSQLQLLQAIDWPGAEGSNHRVDLDALKRLPPPYEEVFKRRGWLKTIFAQAQSLAHWGSTVRVLGAPQHGAVSKPNQKNH
jgi:hypothetical protein